MHSAIIGAGNVDRALGGQWLKCDHDVRFGVPNPATEKYGGAGQDFAFAVVRRR